MAISAIPTGLPAFVSGLLSMGAKELAESKAVVKNLTDVETLGATSAINTDKTGTLTLNQMMVSVLFVAGSWFPVEGEGYKKTGEIRTVAGVALPDLTRLALGLCLDSDATVSDDGDVVGDPTEAASSSSPPSWGWTPRRPVGPTHVSRRCRSIRSTSSWPPSTGSSSMGPSIRSSSSRAPRTSFSARCSRSGGPLSGADVPIDAMRGEIEAANQRWARKVSVCSPSPRVLSPTTSST